MTYLNPATFHAEIKTAGGLLTGIQVFRVTPQRKGRLLRIGPPIALLVLTAVHPGYSADAGNEINRVASAPAWLPLHLGLLVAFALYTVSLLSWPTARGWWWRLRRIAVLLNLIFYSAFVGVDGVAAWLIAWAGVHAPAELQPGFTSAVAVLFNADLVRMLALLGAAGWVLATLAITIEAAHDTRQLMVSGLLLASGAAFGISMDPPIGPFGAGLALVAAIVLERTKTPQSGTAPTSTEQGPDEDGLPLPEEAVAGRFGKQVE